MLRYAEVCLSSLEVPGEVSLCVYVSGCVNHCKSCHYPELQSPRFGNPLVDALPSIVSAYLSRATCLCMLGEGASGGREREELARFASYAHEHDLRAALYSGRDVEVEPWMASSFDYVKVGSYKEGLGGLTSPMTNQRLYLIADGVVEDITCRFWAPL